MTPLVRRFLKYVSFDTQSDPKSCMHPSTPGQLEFGRYLAAEMRKTGLKKVRISEAGLVFAELPASKGCERAPVLGLIAHLDTSDAAPGKNIKPKIVHFDGKMIKYGKLEYLPPEHLKGQDLIVADGTTLLGADDKAGIANIMTALERIIHEKRPHGKLCLAFTPDEEICEGTTFFDVREFGADFAYTLDGGSCEEICGATFNAASVVVDFTGHSVHPGSAKGVMINALRAAMEYNAMIPENELPESTSGREGFYHLTECSGTVASAKSEYILRDHDAALLEKKKKNMRSFARKLNSKYGTGTVRIKITDQYRNMEEVIQKYPFLISIAEDAVRKTGCKPHLDPVRGGTDGAILSFMGLPCPNLGTGGYNFHGKQEFASIQEMEKSVEIIINIVTAFSKMSNPKKK